MKAKQALKILKEYVNIVGDEDVKEAMYVAFESLRKEAKRDKTPVPIKSLEIEQCIKQGMSVKDMATKWECSQVYIKQKIEEYSIETSV